MTKTYSNYGKNFEEKQSESPFLQKLSNSDILYKFTSKNQNDSSASIKPRHRSSTVGSVIQSMIENSSWIAAQSYIPSVALNSNTITSTAIKSLNCKNNRVRMQESLVGTMIGSGKLNSKAKSEVYNSKQDSTPFK